MDLQQRKAGAWTREDAEAFLVAAGDFLIARGNGTLELVGGGALVGPDPGEIAFPDTMIRARPDTEILLPEYLACAWASPDVRRQIEAAARTSAGIYKVNQSALGLIMIPVPPVSEQRRIVDILEEHLSDLEDAETALKHARLRSGVLLLSQLSSGRSGESVPLAEIARIQGGIQKQQRRVPKDNAFPFLRVANVTANGLDLTEVHRIELFGDELDRWRLEGGDLLVVEGNGSPSQIGRAALWDGSIEDCVHQNHLIRVRADRKRMLPAYLEAVWNSPENRRVLTEVSSSSSGLHTLSVSKLNRIQIPLPSLETQAEAARAVAAAREAQGRLKQALDMAQHRSSALRRSLLAAAFSGRLTGRSTDSDTIEQLAVWAPHERRRAERG